MYTKNIKIIEKLNVKFEQANVLLYLPILKTHTARISVSGYVLFVVHALCALGLFAIFINKSNEGSLCTKWSHAGVYRLKNL